MKIRLQASLISLIAVIPCSLFLGGFAWLGNSISNADCRYGGVQYVLISMTNRKFVLPSYGTSIPLGLIALPTVIILDALTAEKHTRSCPPWHEVLKW